MPARSSCDWHLTFIREIGLLKTLNNTHWVAIKAFWTRRVYRLLPSAWLWLAITLACAYLVNSTGTFGSPPTLALRSAVAVTFISANFAQYVGIQLVPNWVYWSLSLEEQFYLLFPFFLLAVPVAWRWRVLLVGIAIQFPLARTYWIDLSWFVRIDAMLWGVLIYLFSKRPEYRVFEPVSLKSWLPATIVSVALFAAIMVVPGMLKPLPYRTGLLAMVSAALVLMASYQRNYILPIRSFQPLLLWLGSRSYAIYLVHTPAFYMTHELWTRWTVAKGLPLPDGTYTVRYLLTAAALTTICSELNYRFVETPLRKKGSRIAKEMIQGDKAAAPA